VKVMVKKQILTSFLIIFVILSLNWSFAVPYLDVSINNPVIERGNSGKIYFEVEEVSGSSNAVNVSVIPEIYDKTSQILPEKRIISTINSRMIIKTFFTIYSSKNTELGEKSGKVLIEYYDFDSEADELLGPKYVQKEFTYEVIEGYGTIFIDSDSKNSSVYIDGKLLGNTPLNVSVKEGTHFLGVSNDFKNYTTKITITPTETEKIFVNFDENVSNENLENPNITENISISESENLKDYPVKNYLLYTILALVLLISIFIYKTKK